ncbi:MAG: saccharopine dehydrogenase NADP-binding domain-containing protein [Salinisphaeraceae bacterium]|nr:saccharopine dehydrogenase NADP-binding domain-containing protein [Salinisphaeraceae bacterium]
MSNPKYDIIVFGATSFVGKILSHYLVETFGKDLNWAAAARSRSKLDALITDLGPAGKDIPTIEADASDEASLKAMCSQAKVIISTVGPYALYGEPLVKACVETGTDYCDLTGEIQWIHRMIQKYETQAKESGARIVHCSGFDSIPSDLGVYYLQQHAQKRFGKPCNKVKMRVWRMRGGASGGTAASLLNAVKEAATDPKTRKIMGNPYSICPDDYQPSLRQPDVKFAQKDSDFGVWVAPFIMAGINTRVVQRSHVLLGQAYGGNFTYEEAMSTGNGLQGAARAASISAAMAGLVVGAAIGPIRGLLAKLFPEPGDGPSPEEQANGFYDLRFHGTTTDGDSLRVKVYGDRDPGYGSTAKMLGQAGACLAFDTPKDEFGGGFWTPASLYGERLIKRLERDAGLSFEILS